MNLVGTLITGRLIGWIIAAWALSLTLGLGGLWLYMDGQRDAAVAAAADVATAKANEACALEKAAAERAAQGELVEAVRGALRVRAEAQAEVDAQRDADEAALRSQLEQERRFANALSTRLRSHLDANPLPAACRLDAERVRLFNALRAGGADPGAAADRAGVPGLPFGELPGAAHAASRPGWDSKRGWAAGAGGLGWRGASSLPIGAADVPGLRAPGEDRWRDPVRQATL